MTPTGDHPPNSGELRNRLGDLSRDLEARRARDAEAGRVQAAEDGSMAQAGRAMSLGFRAITELMVGLGVGAGIGWGIDRAIGTAPLFMILLLFLGMAAGVWNVMRIANTMNAAGAEPGKPPGGDNGPKGPPHAG